MAAITAAVSAASTTDNLLSLTSASFTPAAGDLLVGIGIVTDGDIGNFTDSQNIGGRPWPGHLLTTKNASRDETQICIADGFAAASPMTVTMETGGGPSSGIAFCILRVSGMSLHGFNAFREILQSPLFNFGSELNQLGPAIPSPSFISAPLTANPLIGLLAVALNPTGATEPTGWTKQFDIGYSTPATGLEVVSINSGFTSQSVPWGSLVSAEFCDCIVELDASAAPSQQTPIEYVPLRGILHANAPLRGVKNSSVPLRGRP